MITGVLLLNKFVTHLGKTQPSEAKEEKTPPARWVCTALGAKPYPEHPHHRASTHKIMHSMILSETPISQQILSDLVLIKKKVSWQSTTCFWINYSFLTSVLLPGQRCEFSNPDNSRKPLLKCPPERDQHLSITPAFWSLGTNPFAQAQGKGVLCIVPHYLITDFFQNSFPKVSLYLFVTAMYNPYLSPKWDVLFQKLTVSNLSLEMSSMVS